ELTDTVRIYQDGDLVAEAQHTMGIYADMPRTAGVRANIFQVQNLKTSALMIAGLRDDPLSREIAQDQGRAIAQRMALASPQLPSLVKARTLHLERFLQQHGHRYPQVLVLAVGLDPKPVTFARAGQRWFGLDLRDMLREREERFALARAGGPSTASFTPVVADFRLDTWDGAVVQAGFSPELPTFIIAEGLSMYLTRGELGGLFQKLRALTASPETRLWIDHVTSELFDLDVIEVRSFLAAMTRLGEPFVLGFDDASSVLPGVWAPVESASAADVLSLVEPVHREYRFSILRPS
ncbi:MAG: class I SAM-dependent methyltransferase, partial [Opitutaceae bacterium]